MWWHTVTHGRGSEGETGERSILHTTSEHGVSSITTADAHTSAASSRLNWRPRRFIWTRPFRRKTKSGFCACAITFQMKSTKTTRSGKPSAVQTPANYISRRRNPLRPCWPHVQDAWIHWLPSGCYVIPEYLLINTFSSGEHQKKPLSTLSWDQITKLRKLKPSSGGFEH